MNRLKTIIAAQPHDDWRLSIMFRWAIGLLLIAATQAIFGPVVIAQEFRIYTRVSQQTEVNETANESPVVARSLTLFHAGKVYDYIESVREVIVFEPAHKRFTILSIPRSMAAEVKFDELLAKLNIGSKELEKYIAKPRAEGGPTSNVAEGLKFQLLPKFDVAYRPADQSMTLSSPYITYATRCSAPKSPEAISAYMRYADWTCRLNYVLHPQTLYPAARLELNEALRAKKLMPVEVNLSIAGKIPVRFKAEHEIHWQLDAKDRDYINVWERKLKDRDTRRVSFFEYQQAMLVSYSKQSR